MFAILHNSLVPQRLLPGGITRERATSVVASVTINLSMIVAFASIANIDTAKIGQGASLVVVGLSGSESEAGRESKPPPAAPVPPPPAPMPPSTPEAVTKAEPAEQKIALLQPAEQFAEHASAPPAPPAEMRPSEAQLREAAEQQREAQEAARARAERTAAQAHAAQAKAAADTKAAIAATAASGGGTNYAGLFIQHLRRFKRANQVGAGAARIRASIDGRGNLASTTVIQSSGISAFDREAIQTVRRASPFPKPPGGRGRSLDFDFTGR